MLCHAVGRVELEASGAEARGMIRLSLFRSILCKVAEWLDRKAVMASASSISSCRRRKWVRIGKRIEGR